MSKNGDYTMRLRDKHLEWLPDSAKGLTFYDVKDIIEGYECTSKLGIST